MCTVVHAMDDYVVGEVPTFVAMTIPRIGKHFAIKLTADLHCIANLGLATDSVHKAHGANVPWITLNRDKSPSSSVRLCQSCCSCPRICRLLSFSTQISLETYRSR